MKPTALILASLTSLLSIAWTDLHPAEAAAPEGDWVLWYRQPAGRWEEALPLGNGRLGAMVFGGIAHEQIQLDEDTVWAGHPFLARRWGPSDE